MVVSLCLLILGWFSNSFGIGCLLFMIWVDIFGFLYRLGVLEVIGLFVSVVCLLCWFVICRLLLSFRV